jgi:hypothetical protein
MLFRAVVAATLDLSGICHDTSAHSAPPNYSTALKENRHTRQSILYIAVDAHFRHFLLACRFSNAHAAA